MEVNCLNVLIVLSIYVSVESRHLGPQTSSLAVRRHTIPSRHIFNLQQQNIGRTSSLWRQPIIGIPSRRRSFRQTFNRLSDFSRRLPQQVIRRQPYLYLRRRNPFVRISRRQHPSSSSILTRRQILGGVRPISYDRFSAIRSRFPSELGILSRSYPNRQRRLSSIQSTRNTIGRRLHQQRSRPQLRPSAAYYSNILINTQAETDDDSRSDGNIVITNQHSDNTELLVNIRRTPEGTRLNINSPQTPDVLRNYNIYNSNPVSTSFESGMSPSGYIVKDQQTKRQTAHAELRGATHDLRQKKKPRAVPQYTSLQIVPNEFVVEPNLRETVVPGKKQKVKPYTRAIFPADSFFYSATSDPIKITLHSKQLAVQDVTETDSESTMEAKDHDENIKKADPLAPNATTETKLLAPDATLETSSKSDLVISMVPQQESVVPSVARENAPLHETVSPVANKKTAPYSQLHSVASTDFKTESVPHVGPVEKDLKIESVPHVGPVEKYLKVESVPAVAPVEKDLKTESVPHVGPVEKDFKVESVPPVAPVEKDLKIESVPPLVQVEKDLKVESVPPLVPVEKDLKVESVAPVVPVEKDIKVESVAPVVPVKTDLKIESVSSVVPVEKDLKIEYVVPMVKDLKIESTQPVVPVKKDIKIESVPPFVPLETDLKIESVPPVVPVDKDSNVVSEPPTVSVKTDLKIESTPPVVPVENHLKIESAPPVVPVKKDLKIESAPPVVPVKKDLMIESVPTDLPVKKILS